MSGIGSTAPWSATPPPYLTVNWNGPGPQVCLSVRPSGCANANITNSAPMTTTPPAGPGSTIGADGNTFTYILDAACATPGLIALIKEVCTDANPANCTPASSNWVVGTTVPTGATVSWQITATNTSIFDEARNITLTDAVAPSCVAAAGTFTIPERRRASFAPARTSPFRRPT